MPDATRTLVSLHRTRMSEASWMPKTKPPRRAKGWQFRNPILDKLKAEEKSHYWLAHTVAEKTDVSADAIYRYLRAENDATGYTIAACFKALKIDLPS